MAASPMQTKLLLTTTTYILTAPPSSSLRCRIPIFKLFQILLTITWSAQTKDVVIVLLASVLALRDTMASPASVPLALVILTLAQATVSAKLSDSWQALITVMFTNCGIKTPLWAVSVVLATSVLTAVKEAASMASILSTLMMLPLCTSPPTMLELLPLLLPTTFLTTFTST